MNEPFSTVFMAVVSSEQIRSSSDGPPFSITGTRVSVLVSTSPSHMDLVFGDDANDEVSVNVSSRKHIKEQNDIKIIFVHIILLQTHCFLYARACANVYALSAFSILPIPHFLLSVYL